MRMTLGAIVLMAGVGLAQEKAKEVKPREEGATVTGEVKIAGRVRVTNQALTPDCAKICGALTVKSEAAVVDAQGNVKWAFVWIKKGLEGKEFPLPEKEVLLDQKDCRYEPHVFGIRIGQPLRIRNSDPTGHNVHGLPFDNKEFNFGQPVQGQENTVRFIKPESGTMIKVVCNIHGHMSTWAGLVDHPYFAVTDEAGKFAIKGLPPGKYTIAAWQEAWTTEDAKGREQEIEVKAGESKAVTFTLDKKKE
jgi:plastocyanin